MFIRDSYIVRSDLLELPGIRHGFATRSGGVSAIPAVASMNTAVRLGDTEENVAENIARLAAYAGLPGTPVIYSRQIHSTRIMEPAPADVEISPESREFDGYVTDRPGMALLVRAADCLPILFAGTKADGPPVIAAVHAGWRGTAAGIAAEAVGRMCDLGAVRETVRVAVGPGIRECCFEVKNDFIDSVTEMAGADFVRRHICAIDGRFFASLQSMNTEILANVGITPDRIDISPDCTAHMPEVYHSHRATGGNRGTGGGIIGIMNGI